MNTKNKVFLLLILMTFLIFSLLSINIIYNFRDYGIKTIDDKAKTIAQVVENALTSQMVSGVIDDRALFISELEDLSNINKIWLSRSELVIQEYGHGLLNEAPRDKIDREVLRTGLIKKSIKESVFGKSTYRITIPYKAHNQGKINCISCHSSAKVGDTLGAISIEMSIDSAKEKGISILFNTLIIIIILMGLVIIFINFLISPFLNIFDSIKNVMLRAQEGDYSARVANFGSNESKNVAKWINDLLIKIQSTLEDIDNNINIFMVKDKNESKDPLIRVKESVARLSDIYQYRKTIQHDNSLELIYKRFAMVLIKTFGLDHFTMFEANTITGKIVQVYARNEVLCNAEKENCRADKANTIIDSCQFTNICSAFSSRDEEHICIPYSISNELDFILSIVTKTKEETLRVRRITHLITDYIDTSKTEIISKKLTLKLERTANLDGLTGLYNRKYLKDTVPKIIAQANRKNVPIGVLMIDIDLFKPVNDTYGHDVGDNVIKALAATLLENTRASDICIRYGGEEFLLLLYDCDIKHIEAFANKLRLSFSSKDIPANNTTINKTISIGCSIYTKECIDLAHCVKEADGALYEAKNNGRNRVIKFVAKL